MKTGVRICITVCEAKKFRGCNVAKTMRLAHEAADDANAIFQNVNQSNDNVVTAMDADDDKLYL